MKQLSLITAVILDKFSVKRLSCLVHKIVDSIALNFEDSQVGIKFRQSPSSFSFPLLSLGLSDFVCVPWNLRTYNNRSSLNGGHVCPAQLLGICYRTKEVPRGRPVDFYTAQN